MTNKKEERTASKAGRLEARNDALEQELEREREDRERVIHVLEEAVEAAGRPKKRRGRMLWLLLVGGAAYTFGARAGRDRYEQIVTLVKRIRPDGSSGDSASAGSDRMAA